MQDKHFTQLDGLRGIAILIVLIGHVASRPIGMGIQHLGQIPPLGVDLFFVLSGFLITGVLLRAKGRPRFFGNFYARRVLRIAPLYFTLLLFMFGIAHYRWVPFSFESHDLKWWVFTLYIQNIYYKTIGNLGPLVIAITWSLAIEEQFYTVWPLLVAKLNPRMLTSVAIALIAIAPFARFVLPKYGWDPYINPLCRMDAMAMGAILSIWIFQSGPSDALIRKYALRVITLAGLGEIFGLLVHISHYVDKSFVGLAFTGLLALSLVWNPLSALLSIWPLRQTGKISYCLYLVHPSIGAVLYYEMHGASIVQKIVRSTLIILLSYLLSVASWKLFEQPILRLKRYFESSKTQARIDAIGVA